MDYEKKTQATLKQMVVDGKIMQADVEKYFPELTESEDEKIRKALINTLQNKIGIGVVSNGYSREDYIDWLEKQGKQKPVEENKGNYGGISTNSKWKPSKEQLKALGFAIGCTVYPEFQDKRMVLKELLKQLKAL